MTPVEREDLPTMSDMCTGDCEPCRDYNFPDACPCGEASGDPAEVGA